LADPREEHFGPIIVSPPFASSIDVQGNDSGVPRLRVKEPASASPLVDGDRGRIEANAAGAVGKMVARILFRSIMVGAVQAASAVDESGALPLDEGSPFEGNDGADEADIDDLFGP
jgi:hypothetical protein